MTVSDTSVQQQRSGLDRLTRPAVDEPEIRIRPDGRQLLISRGRRPEADDGQADEEGSVPDPEAEASDRVTRGRITTFSEDARRRCRSLLHSLRRADDLRLLFVTLTYHEQHPSPERAERDFDAFWKRLQRKYPHLSCVWKKEPQRRGVVHFHLILIGTRYIPAQWLSQLWHEVTAETSEAHRKSGVDIEPVWGNQDGKLQAYMAEYLGKESEGAWPEAGGPEWEHPGRFWGVRGRTNLPVASWAEWAVHIDHADAARLIRDQLDRWDVDLPDGVLPPSLIINTRGDPQKDLDRLLDRLDRLA
jgi:hypothetical protein